MSTVVWHTKLARTLVQSALFKAKRRTILWQYKPPVQSAFSSCCQLGRQQERLTTGESDRRMEKLLNRDAIRPVATWLSVTGRDVNIDQILHQLPRVDDDVAEAYPAVTKRLTSAAFLVTPGLAHLFDGNNEFFKTAMNQIFQGAKEPFQKQFRRHALVAIVDAVPAISLEPEDEKSQMHGYEGLGVCLLPTPRTIEANGEASSDIPVINFVMHIPKANGNPDRTFTYSAPVANTLFVNGHKHTMFRSDWDSFDGAPYLMTNQQELTELDVPLHRSNIVGFVQPRFVAELEELTEPCIIVSSMGNIVRQLQTQAGEIISASSELEKIIPPLVKKKDEVNAGMQLDIFALVYPQKSSISAKKSKNAPTAPVGTTKTKDVHKLLLNKTRFHKVTSGGGGWGKKAGLLSLEPGIELRQSSQQEDSLFAASLFELDEVEMPRSEILCPPGHIIQFLAKWTDTKNNVEDAVRIEKLTAPVKWSNDDYFQPLAVQKFSVGTVRLPETVTQSHSTTAGTDQLVFCPNQFGFLASSGMSFSLFGRNSSDTQPLQGQAEKLGQDDKGFKQSQEERRGSPIHSTLVQVPNSYIVNVARAGGRLRVEDEHKLISIEKRRRSQETETKADIRTTGQPLLQIQRLTSRLLGKVDDRTVGQQLLQIQRLTSSLLEKVGDQTTGQQPLQIRRQRSGFLSKFDTQDARMSSHIPDHVKEVDADGKLDEHLRKRHEQHIKSGRGHDYKTVVGGPRKYAQEARKVDELVGGLGENSTPPSSSAGQGGR